MRMRNAGIRRRHLPWLITVAIALLVLAGCGGGGTPARSDQAQTATGSNTLGQYKARISAISASYAAAARTLKSSVGPHSTSKQTARALQQFQAHAAQAAASLRFLSPPPVVGGAQQRLAAAFQSIARACQPVIDAARPNNVRRFRHALQTLQGKLQGPLGAETRAAGRQMDSRLASR
jgi:hypothetical protein